MRRLVFVILLGVAGLPGCKAKQQLDASVDELVAGLGACDRKRVAEVVNGFVDPELQSKFASMCKTIAWFGPLKERKQTGMEVGTGGTKGSYTLVFDKGELDLSLSIKADQVIGFEFSGAAWQEANAALHAEEFGEFKVYEFQWRDAEGNPNAGGNSYPRGRIPWWLKLGGLQTDNGKHRVGIKTRIRNAEGMVMFEAPDFNVVEFDARSDGPSVVGELHDTAHIPQTGTFHLELDLRDELSGKETRYSQSVRIQ